MLPLKLGAARRHLRVLCIGAHSDDIEIGCAGTLLRWLGDYERLDVTWCVLSAAGERGVEARRSARALLKRATSRLVLGEFEDACLPAEFRRAKAFFAGLRSQGEFDVVFTHCLHDRHQDHRMVAELTWQAWRDHLVLEYEIPKYEGDLGQPNLFVTLPARLARRKVEHLIKHFGSQRSKSWFSAATFEALMRLRGVEARADTGWAEGFYMRKATL